MAEDQYLNDEILAADIFGDQDDDFVPGSWKEVPPFEDTISINGIEDFLLSTARKEAEVVAKRLMAAIFGTRKRSKNSVRPIGTFQVFLTSMFFGGMRDFINKHLDDKISFSEMQAFIAVELALSFYTCTPGRFFDKKNEDMYPQSRLIPLSKRRYIGILSALGSKPGKTNGDSSVCWSAPLGHSREISRALQTSRTICSSIAYVDRISILSMDDDLLRLRSSQVDAFGLAATNNPKKGLGVTHHGVVSLCTNLFCCV